MSNMLYIYLFLQFCSVEKIFAYSHQSLILITTANSEKLYCVKKDQLLHAEKVLSSAQMSIPEKSTDNLKRTIACYKCCVAFEASYETACKNSWPNWGRGKNCGCPDYE